METDYRIEQDSLGSYKVPSESYYGINTARSYDNFKINNSYVNINLILSMVLVKKSCAMANKKLKLVPDDIGTAIIDACDKILEGNIDYNKEFITNSLQGGAGTSTNMNVNEVIANLALEILGKNKGRYDIVHPLSHVNMSQSTNDVYPTALRIAAINLLRPLTDEFTVLQEVLQEKENEFSHIIKLGRTELMDALPMMMGQGFGAYAKAIARDRWRLYKIEERLREINLGGTAIGTSLNADRKYIYLVTDILQDITGLGISRADYLMDVTQNMDVFVEVSGLLKASAVNLIKISNDLRLLSSGPRGGFNEINLPSRQAGSSIMPGKVNPVMAEMMGEIAIKVIANDTAITMAAASGQLELNSFSPLIADSLLNSLEILKTGVNLFTENCIKGITANEKTCRDNLEKSTALGAALINHIGYDKASKVSLKALNENKTIKQILLEENILTEDKIDKILNPFEVTKPGTPGK